MTTKLCRSCGSCGFPMRTPKDYAGGDKNATYCSTCAETNGTLKPFEKVVEANAHYFVREQGVDAVAADAMARALLLNQPAWRT
jgi:hypothetical protein